MENIILELTDRLLALQARCAIAEDNLKTLEEQFHQLEDAVSAKNDQIETLSAKVDELTKTLKTKEDTIIWQLNKRNALEAELAKLKEEVAHVSEV